MAKDNTKYIFNNKEYVKGRLVLAVVKQYVSDTKPNLNKLKQAFPPNIQGSSGVIIAADELDKKKKNSSDSKNRYFIKNDESLTTSDGKIAFVCTEWGIGNINGFIGKAKELGYDIKVVGDMTNTIKELYEEYKSSPRSDWINNYRERCEQVSKYKNKEPHEYDVKFLKDVWLTPANGIANAKPGVMSNAEFENLLDDLPIITSKILKNPTIDTWNEITIWANEAKAKGKFKTIKRGVINRVFAAASPQSYSSILRKRLVLKLINKLNDTYDLKISTKGDWPELNVALLTAIKNQGLENEDLFLINTFVWRLYVKLIEEEVVDTITAKPKPTISDMGYKEQRCKNVIYYGPPGTGKTYQLQKLLDENYTDNETVLDTSLWLNKELEELSWHEIIILILLDLGEANNVTDIISHQYYKIKAELNERTGNLRATAWAALQSHTVSESETVKFSSRIEPLVFNKTQDSKWFIVDSQNEQVEEYVNILDVLKAGPKQTDTVKRYEFVTFHQSYGYEEFIEGLRPKTTEQGDISYEIKPGVFKRICKLAEADPENQYAMVIDEINRGNISKIFGELITLVEIDKRAGEENELTVTLPYSGLPFTVPSNIDIIGTMNTADRSLTHIDVALRRRFDFKELRTDYSLVADDVDGINVRWMLYAINQRIELLLDREHILGHALLMDVNSLASISHAFKSNIMPLLEEYFFENWDKINQVLNSNGFVEELKEAASTWLGDTDDYAAKSFRINLNALTNIDNYKTIYSGVNESAFDGCEMDTE